MQIEYTEDESRIRWERNGKWKSADLDQLIEAYEAEPTKHGRWIYVKTIINGEKEYKCSECNAPLYCYGTPKQAHYEWCYSCGARMDEVEE